jgi:uncharacterized protein YdhG (YjbR/CyaY superfamily)
MKSQATDVPTYIAEVPAERRAAIEKLRSLCRQNLAGYEECIEYGMPGYKRDGVLEISFASQKQYIAVYVLKGAVVEEFRSRLPAASIGKSCIRFTKAEKIDFEVLGQLLRSTAKSRTAAC